MFALKIFFNAPRVLKRDFHLFRRETIQDLQTAMQRLSAEKMSNLTTLAERERRLNAVKEELRKAKWALHDDKKLLILRLPLAERRKWAKGLRWRERERSREPFEANVDSCNPNASFRRSDRVALEEVLQSHTEALERTEMALSEARAELAAKEEIVCQLEADLAASKEEAVSLRFVAQVSCWPMVMVLPIEKIRQGGLTKYNCSSTCNPRLAHSLLYKIITSLPSFLSADGDGRQGYQRCRDGGPQPAPAAFHFVSLSFGAPGPQAVVKNGPKVLACETLKTLFVQSEHETNRFSSMHCSFESQRCLAWKGTAC